MVLTSDNRSMSEKWRRNVAGTVCTSLDTVASLLQKLLDDAARDGPLPEEDVLPQTAAQAAPDAQTLHLWRSEMRRLALLEGQVRENLDSIQALQNALAQMDVLRNALEATESCDHLKLNQKHLI